jgi:hypothetical protein
VKVVLDTNVFVSGVFFSGPPFQILQAWKNGKIQLVVSPEISDEYRHVGEILAGKHPAIDLEPMLLSFPPPPFVNRYVLTQMMINFLPVRWQVEVISLSAAINTCSKCQDIKISKY